MSRVLVSVTPAHGHIAPLIPLARALRAGGDEVRFATGPDAVELVRRWGFPVRCTGLSMVEAERRYRECVPHSDDLPPAERLRAVCRDLFADIAGGARAADLVPLARHWRPDVVVHDTTEFAAPVAAAHCGARLITHGVSLVNTSPELVAAGGPAVEALHAAWGLDGGVSRMLAASYLDLCPPSLAAALPGAPPNPYPDVRAIRPRLPAGGEPLPAEFAALPIRRTVLVTLGTVVNTRPGAFAALLEAVRGLPLEVVATTGPGVSLDSVGPQPSTVHLAEFLPYDRLLPRCAAVGGHGGAGTLLGALAAGVPSVLVPQGAEQVINALAAQAAGVAVALPPGPNGEPPAAAAIAAALGRVLAEASFRENAERLAAEIRRMPSAAALAARLRTEQRGGRPVVLGSGRRESNPHHQFGRLRLCH